MNGHSPDRLTMAASALLILIGGSNAVAVRFSNAELPPFWGAALRFGAASLLLFMAVLIIRLPLPRGGALLRRILRLRLLGPHRSAGRAYDGDLVSRAVDDLVPRVRSRPGTFPLAGPVRGCDSYRRYSHRLS